MRLFTNPDDYSYINDNSKKDNDKSEKNSEELNKDNKKDKIE